MQTVSVSVDAHFDAAVAWSSDAVYSYIWFIPKSKALDTRIKIRLSTKVFILQSFSHRLLTLETIISEIITRYVLHLVTFRNNYLRKGLKTPKIMLRFH